MKNRIIFILSLVLVFGMLLSGCDININIGMGDNSSASSSEEPSSNASSEAPSSEENSSQNTENPSYPQINVPEQGNNQKTDSYENLINTLYYTQSAFGEAFIGYIEGPMGTGYREFFEERGYMNDYSFIADIPYERYVETDGNEMYCIVPRDKGASVSVTEWKYSPTGGSYGKVLYKSDAGDPILITCNAHEYIPNVKVVIVDPDGSVYEFSPVLDLNKEWLSVYETPEAWGYDFSVYENAGMKDIFVFEDLIGDWAGFYTTPEDTEVQAHFDFYRAAYGEPCVTFWILEDGTVTEYYEGYAYEQYDENGDFTGSLILEMTLTQGTKSAEKGPILLRSTYEFKRAEWDRNSVVMSRTGGSNLFEDYGLGSFEMAQTMG